MSESQGGAGRREVAWRLFAAEFDDSDFSYSQSDEERAPNYVVTPTGARVNRLFVVGVLTEIETVSEDYLRARVVDPTGPFVIYAGQYQPDALAFLERAEPPTFVAVTGKARTYQPDDSDQVFTSVRPESISEVESETRDRWVVQTAEQTTNRVARMAEAKQSGLAGDELQNALEAHGVEEGLAAGIPLALDHYGTTGDYLAAVRRMALDSARVVADEIDEAESLDAMPGQGSDDAIADLVERPIDADALNDGDAGEEPVDAETAPSESEENAAEAGAGNGSAIGTAESSSQADAASESETVETTTGESTDEATDASTADSADEAGTEPVDEPATESTDVAASEPADEPADTTPEAGDTSTGGDMVTNEPADAPAGGDESSAEATTESPDPTADPDTDAAGDDDLEDFEPEFDLDEDEREEIEEEFGTEFQSGAEVSEPGEAGIETPDPDEVESEAAGAEDAEAQADGTSEATGAEPTTETDDIDETEPADDVAIEDDDATESEAAEDHEADEEPPASETETEPAEDVDLDEVDLEDAVMDAMSDLDDGDGAQRDDVLAAVVDRTGADPGDVEDAIQDALMGGRCYEPDDATLKPI
jgi:RPA family protein